MWILSMSIPVVEFSVLPIFIRSSPGRITLNWYSVNSFLIGILVWMGSQVFPLSLDMYTPKEPEPLSSLYRAAHKRMYPIPLLLWHWKDWYILMSRFTTFISRIKNNDKAMFVGKIIFFYAIFMIIWGYFILSQDSSAPEFIYEKF